MTQTQTDTENKLGALVLACRPDSYFAQLGRTHDWWVRAASIWFANFWIGGIFLLMAVGAVSVGVRALLDALGYGSAGGPPAAVKAAGANAQWLLAEVIFAGGVVVQLAHTWVRTRQRLELREHGIRYRQLFRTGWKEVGFDEMTGIQVGALPPMASLVTERLSGTQVMAREQSEASRRTTMIFRLRSGTEVTAKNLTMAYSPEELERFWRTARGFFPEIVVYLK